ncbi:hypothetical protein CEXT_573861 [Caerostris extrusa]|uniref:Flavin-containing monooxygenase n=1 Tax=Caerostris extrusa TaxID=172846 RepID=A0AAV4SEU4_CAEEX|nr:hypothetical protein CEXT_573861 [Caerostris extrusa]
MGEYPGMDKFQGIIIHTHDLKRVDMFKNKRVLVVGVGCSGLDAAVEISNISSQVYLSSKMELDSAENWTLWFAI